MGFWFCLPYGYLASPPPLPLFVTDNTNSTSYFVRMSHQPLLLLPFKKIPPRNFAAPLAGFFCKMVRRGPKGNTSPPGFMGSGSYPRSETPEPKGGFQMPSASIKPKFLLSSGKNNTQPPHDQCTIIKFFKAMICTFGHISPSQIMQKRDFELLGFPHPIHEQRQGDHALTQGSWKPPQKGHFSFASIIPISTGSIHSYIHSNISGSTFSTVGFFSTAANITKNNGEKRG